MTASFSEMASRQVSRREPKRLRSSMRHKNAASITPAEACSILPAERAQLNGSA
jgi:hypothetical protein